MVFERCLCGIKFRYVEKERIGVVGCRNGINEDREVSGKLLL